MAVGASHARSLTTPQNESPSSMNTSGSGAAATSLRIDARSGTAATTSAASMARSTCARGNAWFVAVADAAG